MEIPEAIEDSRPEQLQEHVLVGWTLVAEWVGPSGVRTLTRSSGSGSGSSNEPPVWQTRGYLHEALFGSWSKPDVE